MNNKRRSQRMENAALLLGVIGAATFCLVYPALICGSLAIVFALLSRGGERTLTSRAKIALILGAIALGIGPRHDYLHICDCRIILWRRGKYGASGIRHARHRF